MALETLTLTREERTWLAAYQKALEARFPDLIKPLIIFGSKARGSSDKDSDLDVLIVIHEGNWKTKNSVAEPGYMLAIGSRCTFSCRSLSQRNGYTTRTIKPLVLAKRYTRWDTCFSPDKPKILPSLICDSRSFQRCG